MLLSSRSLKRSQFIAEAAANCRIVRNFSCLAIARNCHNQPLRNSGSIRRMTSGGEMKMDMLQKAFRQYESAMGSAAATGDRLCQMEAMDGAARCLEALRLQHKICNCRPLEFNTRLLEVAGSVGAKVNC